VTRRRAAPRRRRPSTLPRRATGETRRLPSKPTHQAVGPNGVLHNRDRSAHADAPRTPMAKPRRIRPTVAGICRTNPTAPMHSGPAAAFGPRVLVDAEWRSFHRTSCLLDRARQESPGRPRFPSIPLPRPRTNGSYRAGPHPAASGRPPEGPQHPGDEARGCRLASTFTPVVSAEFPVNF